MTPYERPYPLEPLIAFAERTIDVWENDPNGRRRAYYVNQVLGTDRFHMARWRKLGLTELEADRLAVGLGRHPCEIWPDWFAMAVAS